MGATGAGETAATGPAGATGSGGGTGATGVTGPFFLTNLTVYVDGNPLIGNDATGQVQVRALPFLTISRALAAASAAVTSASEYHVQIMPGTYDEVITWPTNIRDISLQVYDIDPVFITGNQVIAVPSTTLDFQGLVFLGSLGFTSGTGTVTLTDCEVTGGISVTTSMAALNLVRGSVFVTTDVPVVSISTSSSTGFFATQTEFNGFGSGVGYLLTPFAFQMTGSVGTTITSCSFTNFGWSNATGPVGIYLLNNPTAGADDTTLTLNTFDNLQVNSAVAFVLVEEQSGMAPHFATVTRNTITGTATGSFTYYGTIAAPSPNTANAIFSYNLNQIVAAGGVNLTSIEGGAASNTQQFRHNEHPSGIQFQIGAGDLSSLVVNDEDNAGAVISNTGTGGSVRVITATAYTFLPTDSVVFFTNGPPLTINLPTPIASMIGKDLTFSTTTTVVWTFNPPPSATVYNNVLGAKVHGVSLRCTGVSWVLYAATS